GEGLWERLGRVPALKGQGDRPLIWVHAVSVGEVLAVSRLIKELDAALPDCFVGVSTTTRTGQALARERFGADRVFYCPLDLPWAVRAYLNALKPRLLVLAETEFWPNLLSGCFRRQIPVAVVNARVSDRSWPRYRRLRLLWRPFLSRLSRVLAQSQTDAERLKAIGCLPERVEVAGNLKFDVRAGEEADATRVLKALKLGLRLVVAGSTLEGEEVALLEAWPRLLEADPRLVLVLAPRHPERFAAVARLIEESGIPWKRRSNWREQPAGAIKLLQAGQIVLLDTIGELASVYSLASVAFVGGSLVAAGGHNPLEPAQFGVPVVVGPHYANFRAITEDLRAHNGLRVAEKEGLAGVLIELLQDQAVAAEMGERAKQVFEQQAGPTVRSVEALRTLITPEPVPANAIHSDPVHANGIHATPVQAQPAQAETVQTDAVQNESVHAEPFHSGSGVEAKSLSNGKRGLLLPLVPAYRLALWLRERRLGTNLERVKRLRWPVVSIGNLSTGGAGKTPLTIALAKALVRHHLRVDVLSRGYGRKDQAASHVVTGGSAEEFGDEPLLIAREAGVPVYVATLRYDAGVLAEGDAAAIAFLGEEQKPVVHLLDDGFQHRQLHRDVDIVLLDRQDWTATLLPAGNLREPVKAIHRASIVAIPADDPRLEEDLRAWGWQGPIWRLHRRMEIPTIDGPVAAFCGIARPEQFLAGLEAGGLQVAVRKAFPDHHSYETKDLESLTTAARAAGAAALITTEKDLVRLGGMSSRFGDFLPLKTAGLRVEIEDEGQAVEGLLKRLKPSPSRPAM
ncbi:MAG TPA: tetraacyldisaccharide 4'-kinase, partial [Bryobacteraceae bacterium]|nr:tetraacyldisaccharide 4'-kinase [Bryobacteraceae bacterium]